MFCEIKITGRQPALFGGKVRACKWPAEMRGQCLINPNSEQTKMLVHGMENFVGVLGNIVMGLGQGRH